jgi:hypothetical protein
LVASNPAVGQFPLRDEDRQRVVFAGDHKSFAIALPPLINVTNYSNAIGFHDEHKSYVLVHGEGLDIDAFAVTRVSQRRYSLHSSISMA